MEIFQAPTATHSSLTTDIQSAFLNTDRTAALTTSALTDTLPLPRSSSITFIDTAAPDYDLLKQGLRPGTEVHILDTTQDAIAQITQVLAGRSGISSLNIVSHGAMGSIDFASSTLDQSNLNQYLSDFQTWAKALTPDADIMLYGCDIAQGMQGESFVQQLSQFTGADIAASNNLTGSTKLGGNWTLEYNTGEIETANIFEPWAQAAYNHVLAIFNVTNTNDNGTGSLRQAILDANARAGADEIRFSLRGSGMKTITLTTGHLEISDQLFISGLGQNQLTISGNKASRVFQINSGVSVSLRGLTIADGRNDYGGAIANFGKLDIRNSALKNNSGANGGAILSGDFFGSNAGVTLTLDNVQVTNNTGSLGGAINNLATATIRRSTFSTNVTDNGGWGGAILNQGTSLQVDRSVFTQNKADIGGAIRNNGQLTVRNSTFRGNVAARGGAIGVGFSRATTVVENSTLNGNTAELGGGIYNIGMLRVDGSSVTANRATLDGGGLYNSASATVSYSTFRSNTATRDGGGIYNTSFDPLMGVTLEFSTVESNRAANGGGIFNAVASTTRVRESVIRKNIATKTGPDLNGAFISDGGNLIGSAKGSSGLVDGVLSDTVG